MRFTDRLPMISAAGAYARDVRDVHQVVVVPVSDQDRLRLAQLRQRVQRHADECGIRDDPPVQRHVRQGRIREHWSGDDDRRAVLQQKPADAEEAHLERIRTHRDGAGSRRRVRRRPQRAGASTC
jgi:hypothetical protein